MAEAVTALAGLAIFVILIILLIVGLIVFSIVFWIMMLVDCVKKKFKNENDKIVWVLVIIFAGIIGALIYYFVVKRGY